MAKAKRPVAYSPKICGHPDDFEINKLFTKASIRFGKNRRVERPEEMIAWYKWWFLLKVRVRYRLASLVRSKIA